MNIVRHPAVAALTSALALGLFAGCPAKTPEGSTNPPGEGEPTDTSDMGGEEPPASDDGSSEGGEEQPGGEQPAQGQPCEAKIAEAPTLLFNNKVLVRPPVNVELVEQNPGFATTMQTAGFVSACDATVKRMTLSLFQNDPKKGLDAFSAEFIKSLERAGFTNGTPQAPTVNTQTDYHQAVQYPASGGQKPIHLYVASRRIGDFVFVATYEAEPEEFAALVPTFKNSAQSILLVPDGA